VSKQIIIDKAQTCGVKGQNYFTWNAHKY